MIAFSLDSYLSAEQARVEALLEQSLAGQVERVPKRLWEAMRYSLMAGGKRLRPVLVLAFAKAVQKSGDFKLAEAAACAVEYVHTYSLIHDDLPAMDNDDLRRGMPTSHKKFGEAMAILAGDGLLTEAFGLMVPHPSRPEAASEAGLRAGGLLCAELAYGAGAAGMVGGQVMDIAEDRPAEINYLTQLHRLKTGALIRASCRMGVLAAGGTAEQLAAATRYGEAVGLAFQIADDILDATATAEQMGKPTGADAAAGRHTYPAVMGLPASRALAKKTVEEAVQAVSALEPTFGPLAALAHYSVERAV